MIHEIMSPMSDQELLAELVGKTKANALLRNNCLHDLFGFGSASNLALKNNGISECNAPAYQAVKKLHAAKELVTRCLLKNMEAGIEMTSPTAVSQFFQLKIGSREHEEFWCLWLNNRHNLIAAEKMFNGTIDGCSIPVREVVKRAIEVNAASVIFAHNHPSGNEAESDSDVVITKRLKSALDLLEIRTLDHVVVTATKHTSFAEKGLI